MVDISNNYSLINNLIAGNGSNSGNVTFTLPTARGDGKFEQPIIGCLINDISIKLSNKWQAVFPNIDSLTLASQIMSDDGDALTWVRSTQSAWLGSEPLRVSIPFYLFSMNASSKITDKINKFRVLMVPTRKSGEEFKVTLHGGYAPIIFEGQWTGGKPGANAGINQTTTDADGKAAELKDASGNAIVDVTIKNSINDDKGLIKIKVGNQFTLSKMLLEDLVVESSPLQVEDGNPLYIKATATFKSNRVLYSDEIISMFTPTISDK